MPDDVTVLVPLTYEELLLMHYALKFHIELADDLGYEEQPGNITKEQWDKHFTELNALTEKIRGYKAGMR